MKNGVLIICGFGLLAAVLYRFAYANAQDPLQAEYVIDCSSPISGKLHIRATLRGNLHDGVIMNGLLRDRILNPEIVSAIDSDGNQWRVQEKQKAIDSEHGPLNYTEFHLTPPTRQEKAKHFLTVTYETGPGVKAGAVPCGEERQVALATDHVVAADATTILLLPQNYVSELSFRILTPPSWTLISTFPAHVRSPEQSMLFSMAFAAGEFQEIDLEQSLAGKEARLFAENDASEATKKALVGILNALGSTLGTSEPITVVNVHRPQQGLRLASPAVPGLVMIDMSSPDIATLRDLVRALVPPWIGARPSLGGYPTMEWFLFGLSHYLALKLPAELGYESGDVLRSIEYTWMREKHQANTTLDADGGVLPQSAQTRIKVVTVMYEIDRLLSGRGGIGTLLHGWRGEGVPNAFRESQALAMLEREALPSEGHFSFEANWELALTPREPKAEPTSVIPIAFTANTEGHIENCGCRRAQNGGLSRRAALIERLRNEHPDLLVVDIGGLFPIEPKKAALDPLVRESTALSIEAMEKIRYDLVCMGPTDFLYGVDLFSNRMKASSIPVLTGDVKWNGQKIGDAGAILSRNGRRIGFVSIVEKLDHGLIHETHEQNTLGLDCRVNAEGVAARLAELRPHVDVLIVCGSLGSALLKEVAASEPRVDLILTSLPVFGESSHGWLDGVPIVSEEMGTFGLTMVELGLDATNAPQTLRVDHHSLPEVAPRSSEIDRLLNEFYVGLASRPEMAEISRGILRWDDWYVEPFVGASKCSSCHASEFEQWKGTPHAFAMQTLRSVYRDHHPGCVVCHVVGYGYGGGYSIAAPRADLEGVQCEICHGGGAEHVLTPGKSNIRRNPPRSVCIECHDDEHSEGFETHFSDAWARIVHGCCAQEQEKEGQ